MQVTLSFSSAFNATQRRSVIELLKTCVLQENELPTMRVVDNRLYFVTDRSPMLVLANLQREGFHYDDFASFEFHNLF